jgi:hypothetical protein
VDEVRTAIDCTLQNYYDWKDKPFLYFLKRREDGLVKIGWSQDITQRLSALWQQHGPLEILAIIPGGPAAEKAIHEWYAALRIEGEWFEPGEDLMIWFEDEDRLKMLLMQRWPESQSDDRLALPLPSQEADAWLPQVTPFEIIDDETEGR